MFNGMMDPDMLRLAQEQMSRMSPDDFARIQQQMMSNPDLMRMASDSMKNMRPEDFKQAADQLKNTRPEDIAEIGEKMAKVSPEDIASMRAHNDARATYELNAAQMLKKQGNDLHNQGKFKDAAEKYLLAKKNLKDIVSAQGRTLLLACSLNLMSCYLKTMQYDECISEGKEVLAYDAKNVKALYRRGQAYKELDKLEDAVSDLGKAHEITPDDEVIANVLSDVKERLAKEGGSRRTGGVLIEEITDEDEVISSSSDAERSVAQSEETAKHSKSKGGISGGGSTNNLEYLQALKDDPEAMRSFQNYMSNADPNTLAAMSGGKAGEVSPDMFKTATNMISSMSPEELQNMLKVASSFQGENPFSTAPVENGFRAGSAPPNLSPDMLKMASDMMSKMSPDEYQKMFEMASSLKGKGPVPTSTNVKSSGQSSNTVSKLSKSLGDDAVNGENIESVASSSGGSFLNSRSAPDLPTSSADLQEQMRNQMKDPAMRQMFTSMFKNMSPDMMANMSEQFGMKLSPEDAAKAQQAMSSLSPDDLDRMMAWADRIQRGVGGAKKAKNWLLGKGGLIMAICMLILAVILHRMGYIGS